MAGYLRFVFETQDVEALMAVLAEYYPFEGFLEGEDSLEAWVNEADADSEMASDIEAIFGGLFESYMIEKIEPANWNEKWEASYQPVEVGNFCYIRASFHDPNPHARYDLVIDPKMSFGTGHHATTHMMIEAMESAGIEGNRVLDLGCGTGVLAILASKMGASSVIAVDIDPNCIENTLENMKANNVSFPVLEGDISSVTGNSYDVILANVNRNALQEMLPGMAESLGEDGVVLMSGILAEDETAMMQNGIEAGLKYIHTSNREEWCCMKFVKG